MSRAKTAQQIAEEKKATLRQAAGAPQAKFSLIAVALITVGAGMLLSRFPGLRQFAGKRALEILLKKVLS